ncbi:MAG TPA: alpha/beta fold hydrolase [Burkholderiales bacterium]|nr:alpha/beta fold hydrolase [Burkholderiales bacterium]
MERSLRVDGLNVRYLEQGEGAPVLLLHGASLGSSADVWTRNLPALAAQRLRTIAPDLPGFGSTDNPQDHSVGYRRRFVLAFMDALGIARASLVGHSQSGRVAVDLAFNDAQRVAKVVVLGTGSLLPPLPGDSSPATDGEDGALSEPTLDESRRLLESNLYHSDLATPEAVALRHRMSVGKNFEAFVARKHSRGVKAEKGGEAPWQKLARCPVPLLLLYGEQDRGEAARRAAIAKELTPQLDLRLLPRCAHLVQWDAADAFAELAGRFLTSH